MPHVISEEKQRALWDAFLDVGEDHECINCSCTALALVQQHIIEVVYNSPLDGPGEALKYVERLHKDNLELLDKLKGGQN